MIILIVPKARPWNKMEAGHDRSQISERFVWEANKQENCSATEKKHY